MTTDYRPDPRRDFRRRHDAPCVQPTTEASQSADRILPARREHEVVTEIERVGRERSALILTQRGWKRWAVIGSVPFIANAIVQTQSRGAFVGAVAGGLVYYYFAPRVHRKVMIPLGALCFCILLAYTPLDYWTRMNTLNAVAGCIRRWY